MDEANDVVWFVTANSVTKKAGEQWTTYTADDLLPGVDLDRFAGNFLYDADIAADGTLWVHAVVALEAPWVGASEMAHWGAIYGDGSSWDKTPGARIGPVGGYYSFPTKGITLDGDGALWMLGSGFFGMSEGEGVMKLEGGEWVDKSGTMSATGYMVDIATDYQGTVWAKRKGATIYEYSGAGTTWNPRTADGMTYPMAFDQSSPNVWLASKDTLVRHNTNTEVSTVIAGGLSLDTAHTVLIGQGNTIWVGGRGVAAVSVSGNSGNVAEFAPNGETFDGTVHALAEDPVDVGGLWIGTLGDGLYYYKEAPTAALAASFRTAIRSAAVRFDRTGARIALRLAGTHGLAPDTRVELRHLDGRVVARGTAGEAMERGIALPGAPARGMYVVSIRDGSNRIDRHIPLK